MKKKCVRVIVPEGIKGHTINYVLQAFFSAANLLGSNHGRISFIIFSNGVVQFDRVELMTIPPEMLPAVVDNMDREYVG